MIKIYRNGQKILEDNPELDIEYFPIKGFEVFDNGIGLNVDNYKSFLTAESEKKIEKGAKGIGRFICLKAFTNIKYESWFTYENVFYKREFDFKPHGDGIFNPNVVPQNNTINKQGTTVHLLGFQSGYEKWVPKSSTHLASRIIEHFLPYFLSSRIPEIILIDENGLEYNLNHIYSTSIIGNVESREFFIGEIRFELYLLKLEAKGKETHHIYFCGNDREVVDKRIGSYIHDIEYQVNDDGKEVVFNAYVISQFLDEHILPERTGFTFSNDEDLESDDCQNEIADMVTFKKIRKEAIASIEDILSEYLNEIRSMKLQKYSDHIFEKSPQFMSLLRYKEEDVSKIKPGIKGSTLDVELFKIQQVLDLEVKEQGEKLFEDLQNVEDFDEYQKQYSLYIEKLNETGKTQLANYLIHRKSVIDLFDRLLNSDEEGKFENEDTIHNIFFPIRSLSDEIPYKHQNLWLLDERLSFHNYLASDKPLSTNHNIETGNQDRPDLLIFKHKFTFVKDKEFPYNGFIIVEFKKPERKDYTVDWERKNPVDQVLSYISDIRDSKVTDRNGKVINFKEGAYFYGFIVCDFNNRLINRVLKLRGFTPMPDGERYFWYNPELRAMMEVVSYQQVLSDARKRNNILFEKLGINQRQ